MANNAYEALERAKKQEADARANRRRAQRGILDFQMKTMLKYSPELSELNSEDDVDRLFATARKGYDAEMARESSSEAARQGYQDSGESSRAIYGNPSTVE